MERAIWISVVIGLLCLGFGIAAAAILEPNCPKEKQTCTTVLIPQYIGKVMYMLPMDSCTCPNRGSD